MKLRIDALGNVTGVVLTKDENLKTLRNITGSQIINFDFDVVPTKSYVVEVPISFTQNGVTHYAYDDVFNKDGKLVVDEYGNPIKRVKTSAVSQNETMLQNMSLFNVNDVIQLKYEMLASKNYFRNFYAKGFYVNGLKGAYDSGNIQASINAISYAVVHAEGNFNIIELSNDGGNTFQQAISDVSIAFPTEGNGQLHIKFDNTPNEFGIMY